MGSRERKIILIIALIVAAAVIARIEVSQGEYIEDADGCRKRQTVRIRFRSAGGHRRQRYHQRAYGEEPRRSARRGRGLLRLDRTA